MTTPMDTRPVGSAEAAAIEAVEARAWADLVAAAPAGYAARIGLAAERAGDAIVVHCAGGGFDRGLFNRPIGLGVVAPATRDAVRDIVAGFRRSGATRFMLVSQPHCRPAEYERWLADEGLLQRGAWDRVVRDGAPLAAAVTAPGSRPITVSRVDGGSVAGWSDFLSSVYGDAGPWLRGVHDRPGWHHYLATERGRIAGARTMYLAAPGQPAFLAIDGPVPGVMTDDYAPDAAILRAIVSDGLALGASGFIADIEAPSPGMDTPAYTTFGRLGFRMPYTRLHHTAA